MCKRTPLIPWLVCLAALAVTGLAIQPVIASTVNRTIDVVNRAAISGETVTAIPNAIDFALQEDLTGGLPVKVDASVSAPKSMQASFEGKVLTLLNAERTKRGLRKLSMQSRLVRSAEGHSKDMASKNYFSHTGSNGSSFVDRINAVGYKWSAAGENLYAGGGTYNTPQSCVKGWMNSDGHRTIMLSKNYTQIGVGYVYSAKSTYGGYYTADFGKPR